MNKLTSIILLLFIGIAAQAEYLLIPMDDSQKDHLKAYGIAYSVLEFDKEVEWLLNYKGGAFMTAYYEDFEKLCLLRGVGYKKISNSQAQVIRDEIENPVVNASIVKLLTAPKIAVYTPTSAQPWEVLTGDLPLYDWLHLHHEDFTGQYGKFYAHYRNAPWYKEQVKEAEEMAAKHGYEKVSELKRAVAKKIRDFTLGGGFLFAMCSATDSYDIALAADDVDICADMYDGDAADPQAQSKLDFSKTFAFEGIQLERNPYVYEYSNIDVNPATRGVTEANDVFVLNEFSAKWDVVPTILTQNHEKVIKGFMGQTTAFRKEVVKSSTIIMGENKALNEVRYLHGTMGKGTWTFYGGHDPEDYRHLVNEPPTDLSLHPNSPGYRLILNNLLFPSAKKEKQKT